jgi:protocatechuate 3,4-dioxygenase beta subunit
VALGLLLALVTLGVVAALATSEGSGTGATNVGEAGPETTVEAALAAASTAATVATGSPDEQAATTEPARTCEPTRSNPGGTNNYIPDAPPATSLGRGFVVTGRVRAAADCRPLEGVRIQVWLATETGSERDNRASVRTGPDGRYRIETAPTIAQFGEPNIHVAYDDDRYEPVFIRRVVDLDDDRAVVDLTLGAR